jgi:hypothetical protein
MAGGCTDESPGLERFVGGAGVSEENGNCSPRDDNARKASTLVLSMLTEGRFLIFCCHKKKEEKKSAILFNLDF